MVMRVPLSVTISYFSSPYVTLVVDNSSQSYYFHLDLALNIVSFLTHHLFPVLFIFRSLRISAQARSFGYKLQILT